MAQKFLTDIEVTQGLIDSSGDLGAAGQVLSSTGSGTNWITNEANSTVVYLDEFTGDNSTVDFTLSVSVTDENITQVYIDGVYQNKDTYSVSGTTLTFSTAPPLNADIEVITFSTATTSDDLSAGSVIIPVKNTHTASIAKGEPVYITGNVGASARLQIAPADASNSAKMPSAGLLLQTLAVNAQGYVITGGYLRNITTDTIDGTSTSSNDTVYVKAGGGLTMTKPTGSNLIQNVAKVASSSGGNSGSLLVSSILRTNDIPNLTTGKIWVGDGNTTESTVVHLDESNNRLGINNNSPSYSLDVTGTANISGAITTNSTVDGRDVSVDGAKLDGIEASADVTDTANVTAAGALMDSEVTNLADVKAFDTTDYATAAQGALADSAQQPPSEGAFVNGDKTKLDGIAAGAEVNVQSDWNSTSGDNLILNKPSIPSITGLATETYVDTAISDLVDSSPATLNTLNELAAALGDDPNFATTTATSIGTKLPLAGGTLTGTLTINNAASDKKIAFRRTGGKSISIEHDTSQIYFYNETDSSVLFTIANNANLTTTGSISVSGGNSGQWNTAYGWGDHASAGYLTSYTETDTLATVTARGASTSTAVTFTGDMTAKNVKFLGGTSYNENIRMHPGSNDYSSIVLGAVSGDSGTGTGQWTLVRYPNPTHQQKFSIRHNSTDHVTITTSGNLTNHVDTRSPIFYSSSDTSYYLNPNNQLSLKVYGEIANSNAYQGNLQPGALNFGRTDTDYRWDGSTWASDIRLGMLLNFSEYYEIGFHDAGDSVNSFVYYNGTDFEMGRDIGWGTSHFTFTESVRSPIFYDSNDTNYYLNPASDSRINNINVDGGAAYPLQTSSTQRYSILIRNTNNTVNTNYGWWWFMDTNFNMGFHADGAGDRLTLTRDGDLTIAQSSRAPIFYDSDNTNYYVNPNGASRLHNIVVGDGTPDTAPAGTTFSNTIKSTGGNTRVVNFEGAGTSISTWYTVGNTAYGAIDQNSTYMSFWQNLGLGWQEQFRIHRGYQESLNSLRAPLFYDSNDTGYYVNPAGVTRLSGLKLEPGTTNQASGDDNVLWIHRVNNNDWGVQVNADQGSATDYGFEFLGGSSHTYAFSGVAAGTRYFNVGSSYAQHDGSFRAPIFYDSNDTAYYTDPNSTSRINALTANSILVGSTAAGLVVTPSWTSADADQWPYLYWHRDNSNDWDEGLIKNGSSRGFFGKPGWGIHMHSTKSFHVFSSNWTRNFGVEHGGSCRAAGDLRAPIFYDLDDTGYYVDPAVGSVLKGVQINTSSNGTGNALKIYATGAHQYPQIYSNGGWEAMWNYKNNAAEWYVGLRTTSQLLGTSGFHFFNTTSSQTVGGWDINGHSYSIASSRAPIFYDQNNTAYYVDPASGTNLNGNTRITNTRFGVSTSGTFAFSTGYGFHTIENNAANEPVCMFYQQTTGNHYGINVISAGNPNNTTSRFFLGQGATSERIKIYSNGNIQNANNSYGQLSDINLKENVVDATPKLDAINQVRIVNFNYIGDVDEETNTPNKQIGVVAQELEEIFPGMVYECGDTETTTKAVKYSVFVPILIKAMQELKANNDALQARIETLENN